MWEQSVTVNLMNTTERFWATIEYVRPGEAIVSLTDSSGEWAGGGIVAIRSRSRADLYEAGYVHASARAAAKGGSLDRYAEAA